MSKASVAFLIKQIALEEPEVTAVGISPGLCDTKMVAGLLTGAREYPFRDSSHRPDVPQTRDGGRKTSRNMRTSQVKLNS